MQLVLLATTKVIAISSYQITIHHVLGRVLISGESLCVNPIYHVPIFETPYL